MKKRREKKGKEMSCVTEKKKKRKRKVNWEVFRWDLRTKMFLREIRQKCEKRKTERTSMWCRNYKRKKNGLIYSQPAKDLEILGAAACVLLVSLSGHFSPVKWKAEGEKIMLMGLNARSYWERRLEGTVEQLNRGQWKLSVSTVLLMFSVRYKCRSVL